MRPPASTWASCSRTAAITPTRWRPTGGRSAPTIATRTRITTPRASMICWATTPRPCATCESAGIWRAGNVSRTPLAPATVERYVVPTPVSLPELSCRSILVVDDDPDVRDAVADVLADEGYGVTGVASGREALRH